MEDDFNRRRSVQPKPDFNVEVDDDNKVNVVETSQESVGPPMLNKPKPKKNNFFTRLKSRQLTKKDYIILGIVLLILILAVSSYFIFHKSPKKVVIVTHKSAVKPPPVIKSRLTGLPVTQQQYDLPVTAVMIENTDQARPQSGLSQAGVVFEAIAEAGITRFVAIFEEGQPNSLGPIRSARPYYIDWMLAFDAAYVHVGGSPDALSYLPQVNAKNFDEFYNGGSFTRVSTRPAPHNVYTSMSTLLSAEQSKGWTKSTFAGFQRKADNPSKTPNAVSIDVNPSSADFASHYTYQKSTNSYLRSEGGAPMTDANTNKQINPKVVIVIVVPQTQGSLDASGAYYTDYQDIGSGTAYIFQDGIVTTGNWNKSSATSQITFTDAAGNAIPLNAGQTWITAIGSSSFVSYQ